MTQLHDPALAGAVMFYSMSCYRKFDEIGPTAAQKAAEVAGFWMLEQAPVRGKDGEFPKKDLPSFGPKSIIYAIALGLAYLVWIYEGKGLPPSPLFAAALDGYRMYKLM